MAIDTAAALRKLQSGQTLTAAEKAALNIGPAVVEPTPTPTVTKQLNQMTPEELAAYQKARLNKITTTRETGGGTTPPYEAPADSYWSYIGGQWKLYKKTITPPAGGGGGGGGGGNTGATGATGTTYTGSGTSTDPLKLNGSNFTGSLGGVNYVNGVKEDTAKKTAQENFRAALSEMGLADLADVVDDFIKQDYSAAQIKLELPKTQAYTLRFPGMKALRDAGQAVSEATYISMEKSYLQTLQAYGLDTKALGSRQQLGTYIGNMVSPREFEQRVDLAATRVKQNPDVIAQFKTYYPEVDNSALTAYLLNPTVGMDVIKKQVRLAEIGAASKAVGFMGGIAMSTAEGLLGAVGEQEYQATKQAFAQAKQLATTQERLAKIEGATTDTNIEAIQATVGKDINAALASQKRAERETMGRFGGRSGLTSASLSGTVNL